jgi:hypothetical protein
MPFDAHTNFAVSTVAVLPSPAVSGTSLTVASGEGARFPAAPFNATIAPIAAQPTPANAEIVRVTARTGDVLTIARAQEATAARTIQIGDLIAATITARTLTAIEGARGSWVPSIGGSGGQSGQTYGAERYGSYTQIGDIVLASLRVGLTTVGTITGGVQIQGLPIPAEITSGDYFTALGWYQLVGTWYSVFGVLLAGTTAIVLTGAPVAGAGNLGTSISQTDLQSGTIFRGTILYRAALP